MPSMVPTGIFHNPASANPSPSTSAARRMPPEAHVPSSARVKTCSAGHVCVPVVTNVGENTYLLLFPVSWSDDNPGRSNQYVPSARGTSGHVTPCHVGGFVPDTGSSALSTSGKRL